ncbi:MAG: glycosyl hydrolase family 65 protein [Spirochaetaceae bacterium]
MELRENLYTESTWDIHETSYDPKQIVATGSNFMTGNGYLGYRGTFGYSRKDEYVACIVTDTYDMADGTWKELVNAPNPLYLSVEVDGEPLRLGRGDYAEYSRGLEFRQGRFTARGSWEGRKISSYLEQRFASYANLHAIPGRTEITGEPGALLAVQCGIDGDVWSLNGEHFVSYEPSIREGRLYVTAVTGEHSITVVSAVSNVVKEGVIRSDKVRYGAKSVFRDLEVELSKEGRAVIESYALIYSSNDLDDPVGAARDDMGILEKHGYEAALREHRSIWDEMWRDYDTVIEGDEFSQTLLRYNSYHNIIATPAHTDHLPIGARGLSCQAYQGAAFWDQEIFNLPMFLYARPEIARNILTYRYKTLNGARKKARDLGYEGAFYAWISGDTGEEICPSYFFVDVLSGRKIRNHFNDWQIHISPDIVYAVSKYLEVTGDRSFLKEGGAEIAMEVARFIYSRVHYAPARDRYEILRVLGPDEYHENVDNNAFTNYQCRFALEFALRLRRELEEEDPAFLEELDRRLGVEPGELETWRDIADRLYVPTPREEDRLIEQFDGYFDHEDITPEKLKERLKDPGEYWGWPNGIAVATQVSKQADVTQLFMLHPDVYDRETMKRNWEYYEPRTQHGSSLSPSVYSITASWIGHVEEAYDYFLKSGTVDLFNSSKAVSGGTFIGGIHTAACGAAWQMVTIGFAGLRATEEGFDFHPHLPERWTRLRFSLSWRGNRLSVEVTPDEIEVSSGKDNPGAPVVRLDETEQRVGPGETVSLSRRR